MGIASRESHVVTEYESQSHWSYTVDDEASDQDDLSDEESDEDCVMTSPPTSTEEGQDCVITGPPASTAATPQSVKRGRGRPGKGQESQDPKDVEKREAKWVRTTPLQISMSD